MTRLIVAQTDPSRLAGHPCAPLPVGVVRWPRERLSVVVKATYTFDPTKPRQTLALAAEHDPILLASPSERPGAGPSELETADDLVAFKPQTDVLVVGHAHAPEPTERINVRLRLACPSVSGIDRTFSALGGKSERFPLTLGYLRAADGASATEAVGPAGPFTDVLGAEQGGPEVHPGIEVSEARDDDAISWNDLVFGGDLYRTGGISFASSEQRTSHIESRGTLELTGLVQGGEPRVLELPNHLPVVIVETGSAETFVVMYCDTVTIDTDRNTVSLVWRGQAAYRGEAEHDVRRITVSLEPDEEELRPLTDVYRDLQRGHYFRATEAGDFDEEAPTETEGDDLELVLAKYETWGLTPEPTLELERYVAIGAALSGADNRGETLVQHGLDEDTWLLEEQAWMARLSAAIGNDDELLRRYDTVVKAIKSGTPTGRRNG